MSVDFNRQAVELPGTRRPGQTGIYRRVGCENALMTTPKAFPHVKTIYDAFQNGLRISPDKPMLGSRSYDPVTKKFGDYVWLTYTEVSDRITRFGSGLIKVHQDAFQLAEVTQRWTVGIWGINRPEWSIASEACSAYNLTTVGLYDTLGPEAVVYGINHSECSIVVASADHIALLLSKSPEMPGLKVIISMDSLDATKDRQGATCVGPVLRTYAKDKGVKLYDWAEVEAIGAKFERKHTPATPDDIYTICYTSGTTGMPKGVIMTHGNLVAITATSDATTPLTADDILFNFLPLAHLFGRLMDMFAFGVGARIGYFSGDPLMLLEDVAYLKPTVFPGVPRMLNKIYSKVHEATIKDPGLKGTLARKAFADKLANLKAGKGFTHTFWDRLLFSKIRQILGGNVRIIYTGSAPIAANVLAFLRVAFCCEIIEGYGQTEGGGATCNTMEGSFDAGHVGPPSTCSEVKFVDVPELNYFATDKPFPRGEICVRGPSIFRGYLKDEAKTKETLDEEGWMHSGDIGYMRDNGTIVVIDRKKNVFKLSQGEYVAAENIQGKYLSGAPFIQQILIHGDSLESFVVAIVVPDPEAFIPFINKTLGIDIKLGDLEAYNKACRNPKLSNAVLKVLTKVGKDVGLKGFEIPKAVLLETEPFSLENDLVTPTFKLKRHHIVDVYRKELTELYKEAHKRDSNL
ncbi:hypothetical protein BGX27_004254 [Mortierella sp. AM989]|nr:hypothetical protein BGX27_004254 [Mortierella sp. AM989]